jgi:plastocyanin
MKRKLRQLLLVLPVIMFIYSCSKSGNVSKPSPAKTPPGAGVSIQNFAYTPDTVLIKAGATVTWTNNDSSPHTVTSATGLFDSGGLTSGSTFHFTFPAAGTFSYHCKIHTAMKPGVVIVSN